MSWELARLDEKCSIRGCAIAFGDPIFRGDVVTSLVWCAPCAARTGRGAPPAHLDVAAPQVGPVDVAPPAEPQPALFDVEPNGPRYRTADARREVERLRDVLQPEDQP